MRINILLPFYPKFPVGGFKVQYEYANRLAARGHAVTVVHPCTVEQPGNWKARLARAAKRAVESLTDQSRVGWHALGEGVRLLSVPDLRERFLPAADVTVATSWATAEMARVYSPRAGRKFQIVYDYELWMTAAPTLRRRMEEAFRAGLGCVATSPAVAAMLEELNVRAVAYIPCGLDFDAFGVDTPLAQRVRGTVGFPARVQPSKGTADALKALDALRARRGDVLRVSAFGPRPMTSLPVWVRPFWLPTDAELRAFYNSISIFVFPSHYEGWGLPGMEALACGAALVAADSVGVREYARHGETALVVARERPDLLAEAVETLLDDDELRQRLARQGNAHVQQYTWERAVDALEALFTGAARRQVENVSERAASEGRACGRLE
ncbi:MAG TPA: glycosyltransferase family 4 protein [Pyrinomonadaceae bacterium]|nr:glycosyltransferase family 4 protein [Pyrinomonadaceae bacterium]